LYFSLCGGGIIQSLLAVEAAGLLNDDVLQLQTTIIYRHYNSILATVLYREAEKKKTIFFSVHAF